MIYLINLIKKIIQVSYKNWGHFYQVIIFLLIYPVRSWASHAGISPSEGCPYLVALIEHAAIILAAVIGALATIMVLIAAFYYLTAGDDAQKVKRAHSTISWAVVGLVVAGLSGVLIGIVENFVGVAFGCP